MLSVKELRLGNRIQLLKNDIPVAAIEIVGIGGALSGLISYIDFDGEPSPFICLCNKYHRGIPLTAEWLKRLGFVDKLPWEIGAFRLDGENRFIVVDASGYGVIVARQVVYVHQLQNLYFALTGQELEIR